MIVSSDETNPSFDLLCAVMQEAVLCLILELQAADKTEMNSVPCNSICTRQPWMESYVKTGNGNCLNFSLGIEADIW